MGFVVVNMSELWKNPNKFGFSLGLHYLCNLKPKQNKKKKNDTRRTDQNDQ